MTKLDWLLLLFLSPVLVTSISKSGIKTTTTTANVSSTLPNRTLSSTVSPSESRVKPSQQAERRRKSSYEPIFISWINGIAYSPEVAEKECQELSNIFFRLPIHSCYNPSSMRHATDRWGYVQDLTQAGTQLLGRHTAEVSALVDHLRKALAENDGVVIHICHSQGVLITQLATLLMEPHELRNIEIIALGGAAVLQATAKTPFRRCINYYSINDPLLLVTPTAQQALRSGREHAELCFLAPRIGDPILDHYLLQPTYKKALEWESQRIVRQYIAPHRRIRRSVEDGLHHLFLYVAQVLQNNWRKLVQAEKSLTRKLSKWIGWYILRPYFLVYTLFVETIKAAWKRRNAVSAAEEEEESARVFVPVKELQKQQPEELQVQEKTGG